MGYTTDFAGHIGVKPALPQEFIERWNTAKEGTPSKPYVASYANGRRDEPDMLPGFDHPNLRSWCQWELAQANDEDFTSIIWDWGEKFYDYPEWLQVLVNAILKEFPNSTFDDGVIEWNGEEAGDIGYLQVKNNRVHIAYGTNAYSTPQPI